MSRGPPVWAWPDDRQRLEVALADAQTQLAGHGNARGSRQAFGISFTSRVPADLRTHSMCRGESCRPTWELPTGQQGLGRPT